MGTFEATRTQLLDRFGKSFDGHYGWASHILKPGTNEPVRSFTDIEEVVLPHLRPYYQLASHNVHAKAKGIYHRLGLMGDHEITEKRHPASSSEEHRHATHAAVNIGLEESGIGRRPLVLN